MTLSIGRCGTDFTFRNPSAYQVSGDDYQFSGWVNAGSNTLAVIARQQLVGLQDVDEPAVPVVASWDTSLSGFYRVANVQVTPRPGFFDKGVLEWSATLQRIGGIGECRVESFVNGAPRTDLGSHSVTDVDWHATPATAVGYPAKWAAYTARIGPGGSVHFYRSAFYAAASTYQWVIDPSAWYGAGCSIKLNDYLVVGRRGRNVSSFEIGNGLIRVTAGSTGTIMVTAPGSTSSAWGTGKEYDLGWFDSSFQSLAGGITDLTSAKVIRNEAQECVLRLVYEFETASQRPSYLNCDIQVKRGDRLARITLSAPRAFQWGIRTDASTAGTSITGGYVETSNDFNGNRGMVVSASAHTKSVTGPSMVYLTSAGTTIDLGVGVEYGGTGAADPERHTDLRDQYFAAMAESQQVVAY